MKLIFLLLIFAFSYNTHSQGWYPKESCLDSPYLIFSNELKEFGIIDADSIVVIPAKYDEIYFKRSDRDTCRSNDSIAVLVSEKGSEVINLNTFKKVTPPGFVQFVNDYIFYKDSLTWGVYDLSFSLVVENLPGTPLVHKIEWLLPKFGFGKRFHDQRNRYQTEKWEHENEWLKEYPYNLKPTKDIIRYQVIDEPYLTSEKEYLKYLKKRNRNPLDYPDEITNGLVNLINGKKTRAIYHRIQPVIYNNEIYFWCIRFEKLLKQGYSMPAAGYIDVYDKNLKKVNEIHFDKFSPELQSNVILDQILGERGINELLTIERKEKYGAYNGKGSRIIPSKMDSIEYLGKNIYKVTEEQKVTLYNSSGDQVLEGEYNAIKYSHLYFPEVIVQVSSNLNSWSIVGQDGEKKHSNLDWIDYSNGWATFERPNESLKELPHPKYRCIKNNKYCVIFNNEIVKIDSSNYYFDFPTAKVAHHLINKTGDVLFEFSYIAVLNDKYYYGKLNENTGVVANVEGTKLKKIENISKIIGISSDKLKVFFADQSIKYFNPEKWEWESH